MIISHSKNFLFVHIYKTGGTSVTDLFIPYARLIEKISTYWPTKKITSRINTYFKLHDTGNKWINGVHKHAKATEIQSYLGEKYDQYYKFSFVRNPYDLQVSLYHYIKGSKIHRDHLVANEISFKEFVIREIENCAPLQSDFLTDNDNNLIVNFVGKTETIEKSLKEITLNLSIPFVGVSHLNKSKRTKETMSYFDDELKTLVYQYFKRDFELFGYNKE